MWKIAFLMLVGIGLMVLAGRLRQRSVQAAGERRARERETGAALGAAQEVQGVPVHDGAETSSASQREHERS